MTIAPARVNFGLVHSIKFDLSVLLIGSTSSDNGYSDRLGFQLTYLSGLNCENSDFFPCFLKFDQALSQSVGALLPKEHSQSAREIIFKKTKYKQLWTMNRESRIGKHH
ncbi:hypothetical protein ACLOJK_035082 [Asimina triloba]